MTNRINHDFEQAGSDKKPISEMLKEAAGRKEIGSMPTVDEAIRDLTPKGPRLTPEDIDAAIQKAECLIFPGTTVTICCLTLKNGFNVIGQSACVDPKNFDQRTGQEVAIKDAREKVWQLEGYLLKQRLFEQSKKGYGKEGYYTKKPVTIEARAFSGSNFVDILEFIGKNGYVDEKDNLYIKTLEGHHLASPGDMIIKGIKGEFYPCKPDIFEQTYYPATQEEA